MIPTLATQPALFQPALMASKKVSYNQLTEEEKIQTCFTYCSAWYTVPSKNGQLKHHSLSLGHPSNTYLYMSYWHCFSGEPYYSIKKNQKMHSKNW